MDSGEPVSEFLITRLTPPPLGRGFVPRPRLAELLEQAGLYALTLVIAPAGSGKSSLLAGWARQAPAPIAWFSIEPEDNDPVRFWRYLTAALQTAAASPKFSTPVGLAPLGPGAPPRSLDRLCNALADAARPVFLVLDDAHSIDNREVWRSLAYLLDHQPENFHLVVASRLAPPLSLARLRAKNRLLEIRSRELGFTPDETLSFFERNQGGGLSRAQALRAAELTRGWAAGLRLLSHALSQDPGRLDAWREGSRMAAEYLAGEIVDQLPAPWADFLTRLAVLDSFTVELATALAGTDQAARTLDQIQQANLFLDRQGDTFQFHPFFREALLPRLAGSDSRTWRQKAAAWFEAHALPDKAISQALAGEAWELAIRLILQQAEHRLRQGEIQTLQNWIEAVPADEQARSADLQVLGGWVWYLLGQVPQAQALANALAAPEKQAAIHRAGWWVGLRCQLALVQEQNHQALELARLALAETGPGEDFIRGLLLSSLATAAQALGDSAGAVAAYREAVEVNRRAGNQLMAIYSLVSLGIELNAQGQRLRVVALCGEAQSDLAGGDEPLSGLIDLLLARMHWEADQLAEAEAALGEAARKLEHLNIPGFQISADLLRVEILSAREAYAEALRLANLNRRRARAAEMIGFRRLFDLARAEIALKMGNLAAAAGWLEGADLPASPDDDPARDAEFIVKARCLVETGPLDEAGRLLETLEDYARQGRRGRLLISALLARAALEWKRGELGRVRAALEEALALAVPQGYVRLLLDGGALLLGLVAQLPGAPPEIRARFRASAPAGAPELVEMLTAREIDVLRLLAENRTNPEIARQLVLSAETVKVHLKHIFQKLGVGDRRQAARRARELGII